MIQIYHNPRCGKSRDTLKILHERGEDVTIVEYLKESPDAARIKELIRMLAISAHELVRKNETVYKELYKGKTLTEDEWVQAMVEHPILIERPIVVKGKRATLGRPPERVITIL
ncbi:MAG: arsenate reductase (glutaredoxin) [Cyclobacteriaceae bacterium]|nr:arsenate reductase (glutaredoxin) [Cyclobacteriaceae bacterium]